jgi:hypothetical protein
MNPAVQARTLPAQAAFPAPWVTGRHCAPAPPRPCRDHPAASEDSTHRSARITTATDRPPAASALIGPGERRGSADPALSQLPPRKDRK